MSMFAMSALLGAAQAASPAMPFDLSTRTIVATLHAEGAQVYECKAAASGNGPTWTFREPIATLMDNGKTVGRHFAGPHWELDEGSRVQARVAESAAGATPSDIPILKLDVTQHEGHGRLDQVTAIYRLNTRSGALQGPCGEAGQLRSMPYAADYVFAR